MPNTLRRATNADGPAAAALVAAALVEFGLQPDPTGTDADLADIERHYFARGGDFVVLIAPDARLVGTCGLYPLASPSPGAIELRKMYLAPLTRGQGQGRRLLEWAIQRSRELGYRQLRLETACVLKDAIALYERNGFLRDNRALHTCRCDAAFVREL
ncbi:MAG: GNAT family N-acetyltransferase [Opitutus sp.]|nr:GNAT family N-acetyltransferase [Opitutus sp.]